MTIDYDKIRRLVSLLEQNRLTELAVEEEGLSITIKAEAPSDSTVVSVQAAQPGTHIELQYDEHMEPALAEAAQVMPEHHYEITSPMIGIFYRRPSPDSPAFAEVGDDVEVGQTIGLIEAMKVFSEVPSEVGGRVLALPIENGNLVQQGDVLAVIDTSCAPTERYE